MTRTCVRQAPACCRRRRCALWSGAASWIRYQASKAADVPGARSCARGTRTSPSGTGTRKAPGTDPFGTEAGYGVRASRCGPRRISGPAGPQGALDDLVEGDLLTTTVGAVAQLHETVLEAAAHDDGRGHAQELGVGELHARGHALAVVDQHTQSALLEFTGDTQGLLDLVALAGADHVHVGGGDGARPHDALVVVGLLHDGGDHTGDSDAVGTHGHALGLTVGAERVELDRVGVLAAELEDVADLDTARGVERALSVWRGVTVSDVGHVDGPVRGEVPASDEVDDVVLGAVGARDPAGAGHDARVHEVTHLVVEQGARADVTLDQKRVGLEVLLVQDEDLGRFHGRLQPLHVDLAIAGHADGEELPLVGTGLARLDQDVLEGVRLTEVAAQVGGVEEVDEGLDRGGVGGVVFDGLGQSLDRQRLRDGYLHGLDVCGVVRPGTAHEGVLARGGHGQELLGLGAAHGSGGGRDDDVLQAQALEDPHVGGAETLVGGGQPLVVDVEGVGVLHVELAPAQHTSTGAGLVAELLLDLVQPDREVLVGAVLALDQVGEDLLV